MNLIYFLLRSSWRMVAIAIVTGFLSGGSSAGLIALMSHAIAPWAVPKAIASGAVSAGESIAWGFAGLAFVALLTSILARVTLIRLSQNAIFQLQMRLSRQILATELSHLEKLGFPRLLATLTEDVQAISNVKTHQLILRMPHQIEYAWLERNLRLWSKLQADLLG